MNSDFFCPIWGYPHSIDGDKTHFLTRTTLIRHLHTPSHSSTHHLVNHTRCANACIYTCCTSSCPSSPKIFFSSLRALHDHCATIHPPPPPPPPVPTEPPSTPFAISSHLLHSHCPTHTANHWAHGLDFISSVYDHKPPDLRTTWCHFLRSRNKSSFTNLQTASYEPLSQPIPTAPPSTTPHPSGGSSYTLTCSYLHPRLPIQLSHASPTTHAKYTPCLHRQKLKCPTRSK
jgi:hypothetical protein